MISIELCRALFSIYHQEERKQMLNRENSCLHIKWIELPQILIFEKKQNEKPKRKKKREGKNRKFAEEWIFKVRLNIGNKEISVRAAYTYCFFVYT